MLEDLQEKYFDEIRALLPLHRIFLFALGFIATLVSQNQTHKSFTESLLHLDLKRFSFEAGNLLENAQVWHAIFGFLLIFLAWLTSKGITSALFKYLLKKTKASEKITAEGKKIRALLSGSRKAALEQLPYFEKQSAAASKKITRIANLGELFTGIFICFMSAIWFGNVIDFIISIIFFTAALTSIYMAIFMFYSKYVKFDILRSAVSGVSPEISLPSE
jgi:hypothetical protein